MPIKHEIWKVGATPVPLTYRSHRPQISDDVAIKVRTISDFGADYHQ
jgi:hypothetical protein